MAARRVSKSAVDWAAIAERVPAKQGDAYRSFRQASEKYLNRMVELPEELPKINFQDYRNRISNKAMVDQFEKLGLTLNQTTRDPTGIPGIKSRVPSPITQYAAMEIAYPKDTSGASKMIDAEEQQAKVTGERVKQQKKVDIQHFQQLKDVMKLVPPPEQMTRQMYNYYFPEYAQNPNKENPGTVPFEPQFQLENIHLYGEPMYNMKSDRRNVILNDEIEEEAAKDLQKKLAEEAERKAQGQ